MTKKVLARMKGDCSESGHVDGLEAVVLRKRQLEDAEILFGSGENG